MMDPWEGTGERPECPRCEIASSMHCWNMQQNRWYCGGCMRVYDMPEGTEVGGQGKLV